MADIKLTELTAPISDSEPCGPDLDLAGDADFLNLIARAEGLLPTTFFSGPEGLPFDRSAIDLDAEMKAAQPLLARTRDLRLLVLLAKLSVLSRDLNSFITCVSAVAELLESRWDEVHPRGEAGDFAIRAAVIETLNDSAPVVMPLQYIPFVQSSRFGAICYRDVMVANGEVVAREGEEFADRAKIDRALMNVELPVLITSRSAFDGLQASLSAIQKSCNERAASSQSISLENVLALVRRIFAHLNDVVAKRDPSAAIAVPVAQNAEADLAAMSVVISSSLRSNSDVAAALDAVDSYFLRSEPSNPALLLVRQARQLIGKSLIEVLQILMPTQVGEAKFRIGGSQSLEIPIESLAAIATVGPVAAEPSGDVAVETAPAESSDESGLPKAGNRQEALALLEQIGIYYRAAEPSSPISLIVDRARGFANRDFLAVLDDLMPKSTPG
jgi:type VI secretion system protein ImpA